MSCEPVPRSSLREAVHQGRSMLGLAACVLPGPEIVLVTQSAGFDWLLIDTEHAPIDLAEASRMAVAAQMAGLPVLIRTPGPDKPGLVRMLDIGAEGLVVPHVDSAAQARRIVEACRFLELTRFRGRLRGLVDQGRAVTGWSCSFSNVARDL